MRVVELLSRLRDAEIDLWVDGDALRFSAPPGALTPELRAALGAARDEVMDVLRRSSSGQASRIVPVPRDRPLPLSAQQRRMWFFEQVHPGTPTYHMSASWRIGGPLDVAALAACLDIVVSRHETLRTGFRLDGEEPVQEIAGHAGVRLPVVDVTGVGEDERAARIRLLVAAENARPFDLTRPPLLRAMLLRTGGEEHVLVLTIHHIIADMWSLDVLLREIAALYPGGDAAGDALPELPVQYADFAAWQRARLDGGVLGEQVDHWAERLAGAPTLLELPTDRPRPATATYAGAQETVTLPAGLVDAVDALARREGATRFMVLLAAFHILLSRYSGESDTLVGTPVANRTRGEVENLIGFFVNTLVLRADLSDDPTVLDLLRRVRDSALDAFENQDTPVEHLVEALRPRRDPARSPLFQALFVVQNTSMSTLDLPGLRVEPLPSGRPATEFDLTLEFVDPRGSGPGTEPTAAVLYNADVFGGDSMRRLLGHWRVLLEGMVAGPGRRVGELPMLTAGERDLLLGEWNRTARDHDHAPVHERVTRQAARTPDATAVAFRDGTLSYAELDARSAALAHRLRGERITPGRPVAVCVERSPDMIVSLLGVLRSGNGYLPLDPSLPPDRLAYILDDAAAEVVVTTRSQRHLFGSRPLRQVLVDDAGPGPSEPGPHDAGRGGTADDMAYVIYTSGSTGRPKGVVVGHAALANFMSAMDGLLGDRDDGVWLAVTGVTFDIAALELLWPLTHGWKVVLQDDGDVLPGGAARVPAARRRLGFGLFYFAVSSEDGDPEDRYRLLLEGARFADRNGFSAVWTPERHFDPFGGLYPNPAVTSAALAAITERVELRAGSVVLPLHDPIRVAEEWAVVDNLSGGRAGLSFASGWHADDFALAPDAYERRREIMREGIETVRRLWRGETTRVRNGAGREIEVRTFPRPVRPELPVWLAAAGSPETFRLAGELGAGLLTHLLGQSLGELAGKAEVYRRAWRDAGHEGDGHVTLMAHTFVGTDAREVRELVRSPFREYLRRSFGLVRSLAPSLGIDGEPTEEDVEALLDHGFEYYYDGGALMGTAEECAAMAGHIRDAGVDEVACLVDFGVPTAEVLASLPRLDGVRRGFDVDVDVAASAAGGGESYGVAAQIGRHRVTHVQFTPSLASVLLADPATARALAEVDTILVGGEALTGTLASRLAATARGRVLNMYGPTETTIWSTAWQVADAEAGVSIGRPVANTTLYVLDANREPVPAGVPGELWIGGEGVARGYLNRPELTSARFAASPFAEGERIYRTGDRVRYRPDGTLEFLGRVDRQIKLGGHRIELGEIESALAELPAVRHAAVVTREDSGGHRYLAAYLVGGDARPEPPELRESLRRRLPEIMLPAVYVWLDELPLNTSGKVDHHALPAPDAVPRPRAGRASAGRRGHVPPRDDTERIIAEVWQDVLHVEEIGTADDFFELGGHSLMAVQMVSRLRAALGTEVTLRTVFESGTVAELARRVRETGTAPVGAGIPPLVPMPREGAVPLSFAQQRMWFFELMNPGAAAYHLSAALRLRGPLRAAHLRRAFEVVVRRHEILRTRFTEIDGLPMQVVVPAGDVPLPRIDLGGLDAATREAVMLRLARDEARRPFDLARDTLLRTTLVRLGETEHVLLLTTHHIVADSWSIGVMARELGILYDAYRTGTPSPLPELEVQYADFTLWQQEWLGGEVVARQLEFWRETLADAPGVLALPYDRPRPETPAHSGEQAVFRLPDGMSERVEALSAGHGVTVFVTLLAAFAVLLHRWADEERIVLGVPVGGRNVPELEPLIGFFANITVLNVDLTGGPSFAEVLRRVRDRVVSAYDHQDLPVEKLVEDLGVRRDPAYNPLFQVMFVYTNDLALSPVLGGLEVSPVEVHPGSVFMDLNMAMEDGPDGLRGTLDYSTELFDETTVEWLLRGFRQVLEGVLADPGAPIADLPLAAGRPVPASSPASTSASTDALPAVGEIGEIGEMAERDEAVPVVLGATFTADPVLTSLAYWSDQAGLPLKVELAPYSQVFQQVLTPSSAMAVNHDGVNVVLLRPDDWGRGPGRDEAGREFARALAAFQDGRQAPFVVVLCPSPEDDPASRARLAAELGGVKGVVCLDLTAVLDQYGVGDPLDPVSDAAGGIPYTQECFAVLGTCLARQISALTTENPGVVLVDGDRLATGPAEPVRRLMEAARGALSARGRRVVTVGAGGRPLLDVLDEEVLGRGLSYDDCLFLSGDASACAVVRESRPGVVALTCPEEASELAAFLEHTWLFDEPGRPIPGPAWWRGESQ
ncbi:LLM class flavin-dependent oxidoreductase [Microbispora sp. NBC_01189]|uniref:MupA/Atu3671 family FMN-dependent luciferase-like monooxygenase n=1 Tax=Microbispora sp. NBC_01189 TaxID=2903583 RepID=UPI002E14E3B4|nr:LLM class flavin-dependent oxidoreductase [Microbispora sp. NBC_01189]